MKIAANPAVDRWLRATIVSQAEKHLGVNLELGELERNIFLTRITLTDVTLKDLRGSDKSISISRLVVNIDPYAFFIGRIVVRNLQVEGMFLEITRHEDGAIAVDPLFPFWRTRSRPGGGFAKLGFRIETVAFLDADLSFRDIPAGVQLKLEDVVIVLARNLFDPPDRRTVNLRAKQGEMTWKVLPGGRMVPIHSLAGVFAVTPEELSVSKLNIMTDPLSLELSATLPLNRADLITGELSASVEIGSLPWLIHDSDGRITLDGHLGGDMVSPSFRGQLKGTDLRVAGRVIDRIDADLHMDTSGCSLSGGKIQYKGEELVPAIDLYFKRSLPFAMGLKTQRYPVSKILQEVGGSRDVSYGYVNADLMVNGQLSGVTSTIAMKGELVLPIGELGERTMDLALSGRYGQGSLNDLFLSASSGSMELKMQGSMSGQGPRLSLSLLDGDLEGWREIPGSPALGGSLALTGRVEGSWEDAGTRFDLELARPEWDRFRGDVLRAQAEMDKSGISLPVFSLKAGSLEL